MEKKRTNKHGGGILIRIKELLNDGDTNDASLYEALQLIMGQSKRKLQAGNCIEAAIIAQEGSSTLLTISSDGKLPSLQTINGAYQLAQYIIEEIFIPYELPLDDDTRKLIYSVNEDLDRLSTIKEDDVENDKDFSDSRFRAFEVQLDFLKAAQRWSTVVGKRKYGDSGINNLLANLLFRNDDYERGIYYLVAGENPKDLAQFLFLIYPERTRSERDYWLAFSALLFLTFQNLRDANGLMKAYQECQDLSVDEEDEDGITEIEVKSNLIKLIECLLKTCETNATPVFEQLSKHIICLADSEEDDTFESLLQVIGEKFFGLRPPMNMANMMGDMMKMFMS